MRRFHEMLAVVANHWYRCSLCHFEGDLSEAIAHAIANQECVP